MLSFVARHILHFLNEKLTPLNPTMKLEAGMSPTTQITPPYIFLEHSPNVKVYPYNHVSFIHTLILDLHLHVQ